jgi:methyltransferase (TIGR00027 family)
VLQQEPSKTALAVAVLRAVHQLADQTPRILDDPATLKILDPALIEQIRVDPSRYQTPQAMALRAHVVIRSRYAEDRLAEAVLQRGICQYILLGAGLDTFPYRQPEWAHALHIFEVDQPASQGEKQQRMHKAGIPIPANVEFVPIDFERTPVAEGLRASSFDPTLPTFISWLGVMVYLSEAATEAVFRFVARLPRGSEIVFTFSQPLPDRKKVAGDTPTLAERAAKHGEPWKLFITPQDLVPRLHELGFSSVSVPTRDEIEARYIRQRQDGLHAAKRATLASAVV